MVVRPAQTQISVGIRPADQSLLCQHGASLDPKLPFKRLAKSLIRLGDAQADLSLRWTHNHIVGFVVSPTQMQKSTRNP